jgi:hypothetical protein
MASHYAPLPLHQAQLTQALKAFKQNPTPSLASSIKRLQASIKYQQRNK